MKKRQYVPHVIVDGRLECRAEGGCTDERAVNNWLPATSEYFNKLSASSAGFSHLCKKDHLTYARKRRRGDMGLSVALASLTHSIPRDARRAGVPIAPEMLKARTRGPFLLSIWLRQNGQCVICDCELDLQTPMAVGLDKIIPELGYVAGNMQFLCCSCNRRKGDLTPETAWPLMRYFIRSSDAIATRAFYELLKPREAA